MQARRWLLRKKNKMSFHALDHSVPPQFYKSEFLHGVPFSPVNGRKYTTPQQPWKSEYLVLKVQPLENPSAISPEKDYILPNQIWCRFN
jgi:hypothetical protein